ncbi:MAG TPA: hypothetical protein VNG73_10125 [Gemmatimonadaceae bacterium]|nr:hypothetical protein [Gemmatimonadaceae bacterium]
MDEQKNKFLRLTFDGGRFAGHAVPVEVLPELTTFQDLIFTVARRLFLDENTDRKRMPKGFADSAQLLLASTEDNCFTAGLVRPTDSAADHDKYFVDARDLTITALAASALPDADLPPAFPKEAYRLLAEVGRRLGEDEGLIVQNGGGSRAKVTKRSRTRLATMVNVPLEIEETFDGEVEKIDDSSNVFILRRKGEKLEVRYDRPSRARVIEAFAQRPIVGIHFRGLVVSGSSVRKATQVDDLELFEHPRAAEVLKLWARLDHLGEIEDGWIESEGQAPSKDALMRARDVLARLLVDHEWTDRPKLFPTPDGGVQAEWTLGPWACEVVFAPDGSTRGEATQTEDDRESEIELETVTAGNADQLAKWLRTMASNDGDEGRV